MKKIFLLLILLTGCNHLDRGVVLQKHYEPTRSYTVLMPMMVGKTTIMIPHRITDYEDYVLTIEGEHNGEIIHETVYVSQECYNNMEPGSTWVKTQTCSFSDENNYKTIKRGH